MDSEEKLLARIQKTKNLPDRPFSTKNIKISNCIENLSDERFGFTCKINYEKLKKTFPKIDDKPRGISITRGSTSLMVGYKVKTHYTNGKWDAYLDPGSYAICDFEGLCNWSGCIPPDL